ncbi:MAG: hypothetical protein ABI682_15780 [Acidobacteriota bacterium]
MNVSSRFLGRVGLVLLAAAAAVPAASGDEKHSDQRFTARDVRRSYGYSCLGAVNGVPFAQIGQVSCDGKDTCTGTGTISTGPGGPPLLTYVTGKYTVDPNGVGLVTYNISLTPGGPPFPDPLPIRFVLIDGGRELRGFPLVPGYAVICDLKEQ